MTKYTPEEIQEHRRLWVEALRSGDYTQTKNVLARVEEDGVGYCCLGVACVVASANGLDLKMQELTHYPDSEDERTVIVFGEDGEYLTLPRQVAEWLGLGWDNRSPNLNVEYDHVDDMFVDGLPSGNLTSLNDGAEPDVDGWTFEQIADAIEKYGFTLDDPED